MSTQINITVDSGGLTDRAKQQQQAARQAQLEKERQQRIETQGQAQRTANLATAGNASDGTPLYGLGFKQLQIERRPAASRRTENIEVAFAFSEFGFLDGGQQGSTRLYYSSNYADVTGFEPPGPNYEDVFNPAWSIIANASKKIPYEGALLQFEDSNNCGGPNPNVQRAQLSIFVKTTKLVYGNMLIYGTGEVQDGGLERFTLDRTNETTPSYFLASASSKGGGRGCAAAETVNYFPTEIPDVVSWQTGYDAIIGILTIPSGLTRYIINLDTGDAAYHINAFYSFKWAFKSTVNGLPPLSYP